MVFVATLEEYHAALEAGEREIWTAPGMAGYAGVLFLMKMQEEAGGPWHRFVVDCGGDGALALAAMRAGVKAIGFDAGAAGYAKIKDIAAEMSVELLEKA